MVAFHSYSVCILLHCPRWPVIIMKITYGFTIDTNWATCWWCYPLSTNTITTTLLHLDHHRKPRGCVCWRIDVHRPREHCSTGGPPGNHHSCCGDSSSHHLPLLCGVYSCHSSSVLERVQGKGKGAPNAIQWDATSKIWLIFSFST